ncbi:ABC transporter ATP-binding protein [Gorillibacterium massiliense]|uniref:ABC transporter ATP-binding protein n=1 Tax=Gorillibacterium massiliense TaxID=1280390 RepID=UPI0004AD6745|nr:ABC transporter ATP-binding protein [Gorillibacterium massiliense]
MNKVVELKNVTKAYGKVKAVQDVSFTLEADKIYGLLGRNGAGKTTIMHMITAQQFQTSGDIRVFGEDPYENAGVLQKICFIKESLKYPDQFTFANVLSVAANFFPNWDAEFAERLIKDFNLPVNRKMKKLSRGMHSSAGIIIGLASRAPLTLFDEPYLGLDAVARNLFYIRLLEDYSQYPRTIVLSTHLIDEVSQMLEHVLVIDKGRMIVNEESDILRGSAVTITGAAAKVEAFAQGKTIIHREPFGGLLSITVMGALSPMEKMMTKDTGLELTPVSLQQMIVHMTGGNLDVKTEVRV